MSYLHNISCALPPNKLSQEQLGAYMVEQYNFSEEEKSRLLLMYKRSGIQYRHSCLPYFDLNNPNKELYKTAEEPGISERMELYFKHALPLAIEAAKGALLNQNPTHIISVSCTGMAAPGLDLMLLEELNLAHDTHRSSVNFMGCYAYFHALKMADAFCRADKNAHVLIVGVELCTLHFNRKKDTDQIAANLLFADGAAACIVSAQKPNHTTYFSVDSFYSRVVPQGKQDMAWRISEQGFLMTLSAYIPQLLQSNIKSILQEMLQKNQLQNQAISHWGIHPGGRKILDYIQSELGIQPHDLSSSYQVLSEVGNLSSVTLLFVLKKILEKENYNPNQTCFSAGFGPGLTIETMLLNKPKNSV
ncbi:MAG: type III polyketide synthase [Bacteroidia bacterium]|nr:type III polyketide synthase [Bacteroidia bacterium]